MNKRAEVLHSILTAAQTGTIVCKLAGILGIPTYEAFKRFITSKTYSHFREYRSIESMMGDSGLIELFLEEMVKEGKSGPI